MTFYSTINNALIGFIQIYTDAHAGILHNHCSFINYEQPVDHLIVVMKMELLLPRSFSEITV